MELQGHAIMPAGLILLFFLSRFAFYVCVHEHLREHACEDLRMMSGS